MNVIKELPFDIKNYLYEALRTLTKRQSKPYINGEDIKNLALKKILLQHSVNYKPELENAMTTVLLQMASEGKIQTDGSFNFSLKNPYFLSLGFFSDSDSTEDEDDCALCGCEPYLNKTETGLKNPDYNIPQQSSGIFNMAKTTKRPKKQQKKKIHGC